MPKPLYAIGDIHGQLEELLRVLSLIETDGGQDAEIVFLGDYTDRGPDSKSVLDQLVAGKEQSRNWRFLKGNHDRMFEWFVEDVPRHDPHLLVGYHWLHDRLGGLDTLASYDITFPERTRLKDVHAQTMASVPQSHIDFLRELELTYETKNLFFAHAGIRPQVPLDQQSEEDLVWIRQSFHAETRPHPKLIVHGHTPVDKATHYGNRINLDSGAGYGKPLTAAVFEGRDCWLLTPGGRQVLVPTAT